MLYHNDLSILKTIECVLKCNLVWTLYLIDNSASDDLRRIVGDSRIKYIFNKNNIGYGSAHNIGIKRSSEAGCAYHLIMNPDITFAPGTLEGIYSFMEQNRDVGSLMPKVVYPDGELQRLCKLLPSPIDLFGRRFLPNNASLKKRNSKYELHAFSYNDILNTPCLSGCFMFTRVDALKKSGVFDERYFMYLEDYDLNRRIHRHAKTIFYPYAQIVHGHAKESYKNGALLRIHMMSAIKYFNKWGWFFDKERERLNREVLNVIKHHH
nr:glycosyltransferase family 2 protein [Pedobacter sp. JY14-1]